MDKNDFDNYVKSFKQYGDAAESIAKKTLKTSNAINSLNKIFEDNEEALAPANEGTAAYATAIGDL